MSHRSGREAAAVVCGYTLLFLIFFGPVLLTGRLLAPDDGLTYFLPNYYAPHAAWTDLVFGGFPVVADVQAQSFYPPFRLFSAIPGSWNAYVLVGFVLASAFAYGYTRSLTGSPLAGATSGVAFGLSGVLVAHVRHVAFLHTAAWVPLLLWALTELRREARPGWLAAAALAVAFTILGGFAQISVYGLGLAGAYTVWLAVAPVPVGGRDEAGPSAGGKRGGRLAFVAAAVPAFALGIGLAAIQIFPSAELVALTPRASMRYAEFSSYALRWRDLLLLVFPYAWGGAHGVPYTGPWNAAEMSGYVGLLAPLLGVVGLAAYRRTPIAWFWILAGSVAVLLTLGPATALGTLAYHLPGYDKFKVPARHFFEASLATAALCGLGVAALERGVRRRQASSHDLDSAASSTDEPSRTTPRGGDALPRDAGHHAERTNSDPSGSGRVPAIVRGTLSMGAVLFAAALAALVLPETSAGTPEARPAPASVVVPIVVFALAAFALAVWSVRPASRGRQAVLLAVLILDLASFGWLFEWRRAPAREALDPPVTAERYRSRLERSGQRLLATRGHGAPRDAIPVNLSRVWAVPSAGGYNPLILSRVSELYPMTNWGAVYGPWAASGSRALDLMAVRYVTLPARDLDSAAATTGPAGRADQPDVESGILLGSGCGGPQPDRWDYRLPTTARADRLELVTSLRCSTGVPDEAGVLQVELGDSTGGIRVDTLRAGRDTSEWMIDCPGVRPLVHQRRAPVRGSFTAISPTGAPCSVHTFVSTLALPGERTPSRIGLTWIGPAGAIRVHALSLVDTGAGVRTLIDPETSPLLDPQRWRLVERTPSGVAVLENLRALPRAWLVQETVRMSPETALQTIQSSRLPGDRPFDPDETALVESSTDEGKGAAHGRDETTETAARRWERPAAASRGDAGTSGQDEHTPARDPRRPAQAPEAPRQDRGAVYVIDRGDLKMEVLVQSLRPALLVTSDVWYPGWRATVDGRPASLLRADYVLRAVPVPVGRHLVRFTFEPRSVRGGASLTLGSAALLLATTWVWASRAGSRRDESLPERDPTAPAGIGSPGGDPGPA